MTTKILVLENTEGIAELLTFSLSSDYDVLSAANSSEALDIMGQHNPPVLICDITFKDMDGIEFLCKIKKQHPQTEVITITDMAHKDLGVKSLRYEASDFILKPVSSEELEITLERAMKKLAMQKRLSPASGEVFSSVIDTARVTAVKQMIDMMPSSCISLHTKKGIILKTSEAHKKNFGAMEGKKSWEIFNRGSKSSEACPAAQAFKTRSPHIQESVILLKNGEEIQAKIFVAPLINQKDQADLVIEIITF